MTKIEREFRYIPSCVVPGNVNDEKYSIINEFQRKNIVQKKNKQQKLRKI